MISERLEELRGAPAYRNYLRAREEVLRMLDAGRPPGEVVSPSEYWREELEGFDYMLDASPLIVEKLRQHAYHVTGLRHYDYRSNRPRQAEQFAAKLEALRALDEHGLFVPEAPELGGFGHRLDGELVNLDTLKFYEALIALERGAVLGGLRTAGRRQIVWEIGAGWGGFGYQLKTLFPNVTYVISDLPELFLFSATYLTTLFPEAEVVFVADEDDVRSIEDWEALDFVFVANTVLETLQPPRVDLAINMVSFQEMMSAQVDAYARRARELAAPYLYSLNRDRSPYNPEISSVREILERHWWLHEIPVLPESYTQLKLSKKKQARERSEADYRHVIGWRRILEQEAV